MARSRTREPIDPSMTYTPSVGEGPFAFDRSAPAPSPPFMDGSGEGRGEGAKQEPEAQAPGTSSPPGASGSQHTVESQRAALDRPSTPSRSAREAVHEQQASERGRSVRHENARRHEARAIVAGALADYIYKRGVGAEFQGVDFTSWMYELKLWPDESVFEKRGTGSMYKRLMAVGVIKAVRYQQDGGCKHTNHNSSVRPVFEILRTTSQREVLGL